MAQDANQRPDFIPVEQPQQALPDFIPAKSPGASFKERAQPTQGALPPPPQHKPVQAPQQPSEQGSDDLWGLAQQLSPGLRAVVSLNRGMGKLSDWGAEQGRKIGGMIRPPGEVPGIDAPSYDPGPEIKGVSQAAGGLAGGIAMDPRQWALLYGMGAASPMVRTGADLAFGGQMGYGAVQQAGELGKNWDNLSTQQKWEMGTSAALQAGMAGMSGGGAHENFREAVRPHLSPESRPDFIPVEQGQPKEAAKVSDANRQPAPSGISQPSRPVDSGVADVQKLAASATRATSEAGGQMGGSSVAQPKTGGVSGPDETVKFLPGEEAKPLHPDEKAQLEQQAKKPLSQQEALLQRKQQAEWESNRALAAGRVDTAAKDTVGSRGPKPVEASRPEPGPSEATRRGMDRQMQERARAGLAAKSEPVVSEKKPPAQAPSPIRGQGPDALSQYSKNRGAYAPDPEEQKALDAINQKGKAPAQASPTTPTPGQPVREPAAEPLRKPGEVAPGIGEPRPAPARAKEKSNAREQMAAPGTEKPPTETLKTPIADVSKPAGLGKVPPRAKDLASLEKRVRELPNANSAHLNAAKSGLQKLHKDPEVFAEKWNDFLQRYGRDLWRKSPKPPKEGEKGFFSFRGKPTPKPGRAAFTSAVEDLTDKMEVLPKDASIEDRIRLAKSLSEAGRIETGTPAQRTTRGLAGLRTVGKAFADWYMHPETEQRLSQALKGSKDVLLNRSADMGKPAETEFLGAYGRYDEAVQRSQYGLYDFVKQFTKDYKPEVRAALHLYLDFGGDASKLSEAKSAGPKEMRAAAHLASSFTPEEKALADSFKEYYTSRLKEAQQLGVLDHGIEEYATHLYKKDHPTLKGILAENNAGMFNKNFRYALKRIYGDFNDAAKHGKVPDLDIGKAVLAYDRGMNRVIAARKFVKDMWKIKAEDGRPALAVEHSSIRPIIEGHMDRNPAIKAILDADKEAKKALTEAYTLKPHGKAIGPYIDLGLALKKGIEIDPKTIDEDFEKARVAVGDYQSKDVPSLRKWTFSGEGADGKPLFFEANIKIHPDLVDHFDALTKRSAIQQNTALRTFKGVITGAKEIITALPGFHYAQITEHALAHLVNPFHKDTWTGDRLRNHMRNPEIHQLIRDGGLMMFDYDAMHNFGEGLRGLTALPHIGAWFEGVREHLFMNYIPGLKGDIALATLKRNRQWYAKDIASGKLTEQQLYSMSARVGNSAVGGQNLKRLGRNQTVQDVIRLGAFAPDFTESRGRFVGQALRPYGMEARRALFVRMFAVQYLGARILNMMTNNGDPIMDPEYMFDWKIGDRALGIRTIATDIKHLVSDPKGFAFYRMSGLGRLIQWMGDKSKTIGDLLQSESPIGIQEILQEALEKHAISKKTMLDLLKTVGVTSRKFHTPEERKVLEDKTKQREDALHGIRQKTGPKGPSRPNPLRRMSFGEDSSSPKTEPKNNSRIVVEGIDEPKRPEGKYNDRVKIDPFKKGYYERHMHSQVQKT